MTEAASPNTSRAPARLLTQILLAIGAVVVALVMVVLLFPWDVLRAPLNRYVSERTGRHFEITRQLGVKPGWTTRVRLDGLVFANPSWARDPDLIRAEVVEFDLALLPLLRGRLEMPNLALSQPQLGLQMEPDGRRTWALARDGSDETSVPTIGALTVDRGELRFLASAQGADVSATFDVAAAAASPLPLGFQAKGRLKGQPFSATGRAGSVLVLHAPLQAPFPLEVNAVIGRTTLRATGTVASLSGLDGADLAFDLRGANLADLYAVVGVVMPATPRYAVSGRAGKSGPRWTFTKLRGTLGRSDIAGELAYDKSKAVPLLSGALQSRALDFDDLAPLIGLPEQPRSSIGLPVQPRSAAAVAAPPGAPDTSKPVRRVAGAPAGRVLPTATLDLQRLKAMDADVRYSAAAITHVKALPLDRAELRVRLSNGVLDLDSMKLGVAGGSLAGSLRISAEANPAPVRANFNVEGLQLNRLFPTIESTRSSFGKLSGKIDLRGRGNSVAQMLGRSSGNVALLMGQGQISNLLLETMGLDGGEIIKFLVRGDQNVQLRCAAAAFDVTNGVMESRAIVLDTADTVITGGGRVSLLDETLDITLRPRPKDGSILSLRSPLKISGTFNTPRAGPDKAALAGRAGLAIGLALVNPLLGLAATVETGPGKDADCQQVLKVAATPQPAAARAK